MKVFSPFLKGDTTTSGSLNVPQHPTSSAIINPNTGSLYHDTTDNVLKVYTGTQWQIVGEQAIVLNVSRDIEYLLVAGGGGSGGYSGTAYEVGDAGTNSSIAGATISTITAIGGGRGAVWNKDGSQDGGSGGGASGNRSAGSSTSGQGNDGGTAPFGLDGGSGGGGGAGQAGSNGTTTKYGDGGDGLQTNITGVPTYFAGGGGAGGWNYPNGMTRGDGGQGGGGNGTVEISDGNPANVGNPGTANTGGGAGAGDYGIGANHGGGGAGGLLSSSLASVISGSSFTVTTGGGGAAGGSYGAAGGSGVAIFAYDSGSLNCAGGIVGDAGNGRKYNQFNSSGTFKVGSTSDFGVVTSGLAGHWDASNYSSYQGTNSTWYDLSGNGYNLTSTNSPTWNSGGYWTLGSTGYFSGTTGANIPSGNDSYTLLIWTRLSSWSNNGFMSIGGFGVANQSNALRAYSTTNGYLSHYWWANDLLITNNNASLSNNTWFMAVATFDGTTRRVYGNTTLVDSDTPGSSHNVLNTTVHVGVTNTAEYNTGDVAIAMIYNKGLTASEVIQNYNATKTNFV